MHNRRILAVDDDPRILGVLKRILKVAGYEVRTTRNAARAPNVAAKFRPALVILDVRMPVLSGFDVAEALRGRSGTAGIPLVFLTAEGVERNIEEARAVRALAYLIKPFRREALILAVQAALGARDRA